MSSLGADAAEALSCMAFTPGDHRTICGYRSVLHGLGGRQTIATDHEFSPEVLEVFAPGQPDAAFALWRDPSGIVIADLRSGPARVLDQSSMDDALSWVSAALGVSPIHPPRNSAVQRL